MAQVCHDSRVERAIHNRDRLVASARAILARQGYERARMQDVAREAGLSTATLYKHFPTKIGLAEAAISALPERLAKSALLDPALAPGEALAAYLGGYVKMLTDPETIGLIRLVVAEGRSVPALAQALLGLGKQPIHDQLYIYLKNCNNSGALRVNDPVRATALLMGMVNQYFLLGPLIDVKAPLGDPDELIRESVAMFMARYAPS